MTRIGLGHRGGWAALAAGVVVLGLLEAAVLHFLATAYLPPAPATAVDAVAAAFTLLVIAALVSPLWGSFRLDSTTLRLRFGWLASVDIPLSAVVNIRPYKADLRNPAQLGLDFDEESALLTVVRAPSSPLVRIELATEVPARTQGWKRVRARTILASTDDADVLCRRVNEAS
ncbi:hypothetical protein [Nocardia mexicana]|uniref:PH (Pleckstrin Homology) domain-containing protein n=1 Tax=Nocardia mexicana TaxID=279262 RepID=A0A370HB90_9NOCA|nr:hypothetical protein [Nocardia mexicana]RDI54213.1 hypothetical protein DFR68_102337 [Nocardia mexicana]